MSWLPILILTALVFALAVFVLKLPRTLWMLFGSALSYLCFLQLRRMTMGADIKRF